MIQNLVKQNPQMANAWKITQNIINSGGSKEEMLKSACKQGGIDYEKTKNTLDKLNINL